MNHNAPVDQAQGLRRLFAPMTSRLQPRRAAPAVRLVPVVANPHATHSGAVLERLAAAFAELGEHTLVVDACDGLGAPHEATAEALAGAIEHMAPQLSYLAAGGLPLRHVDARGSTATFLHALVEAAPHASVLIVHAGATELCRLFAHGSVRPLLLADDRPDAVTHAYASLKLLATRAGLMSHDLLLCAATTSPRAARIAERLASCADSYLGAVQHDWAHIDPAGAETPGPELLRMVRAQLRSTARLGAPTERPAVHTSMPTLADAPWLRGAAGAAAFAH